MLNQNRYFLLKDSRLIRFGFKQEYLRIVVKKLKKIPLYYFQEFLSYFAYKSHQYLWIKEY